MPTIAEARAAATAKRKRREVEKAAEAAAAEAKAAGPKPSEDEPGLLDRIRAAFSSADDIDRIDRAVDAVSKGVDDADEDSKRKK